MTLCQQNRRIAMKNYSPFQKNHTQLLDLFSKSFFEVYHHMDTEVQPALLDIAPALFRKWYVSALIPETTLSPSVAFRIDFLKELPKENVYSYVMTLDKTGMFQYNLLEYSLEKHPLIEDLKIILKYCSPDCEMSETGDFLEQDKNNLLKQISRQEKEYLHYLILLLYNMEFLVPLSAIHTVRIQPHPKAQDFFKKTTQEILSHIIDVILTTACYEITDAVGADPGYFTKSLFYNFLKSNMDIEDIFIKFYEIVDIDISQIWEVPSVESFTEEEATIASSFFYMGILLDKWFLTPLGDFLQIIQPIYYLPFYFVTTLNRISNLVVAKCSLESELYSPCSVFDLTSIGETVLGKREEKQPLPVRLNFPQILDAIIRHAEINLFENIMQEQGIDLNTPVCPIKISIVRHPEYWKIIELLDNATLYDICTEICSIFDLTEISMYSVTAEHKNSFPFFQGSPLKHKSQKSSPFLPSPFSAGDVLYFTPDKDNSRQLKLEFLPKQKQIPFILYPRLRKQSHKMKLEPFDID